VPIAVTIVESAAGVAIPIAFETMLPSFPFTELLSLFAAAIAVVAIVVTVARGSFRMI
jgi:hypothetical protein